jgi:hypothetical protein
LKTEQNLKKKQAGKKQEKSLQADSTNHCNSSPVMIVLTLC